MKDTVLIWNTALLQVFIDSDGDIVLHERPTMTNDFIFVPPSELEAFCRHYLLALESEE